MGVFEQFPYTNMGNLNLAWVLSVVQKMDAALQDDFTKYIQAWIEEHYNELFFNAAYDTTTETITFSKRGAAK